MKKTWTIGILAGALALGAFAFLSQPQTTIEAQAVDVLTYTFDPEQNTDNRGYSSYFDVTNGGKNWTIPGNQQFSDYMRIGGKGLTNVDRTLTCTSAFSETLSKVTVNHNGVSNGSFQVNSVKLEVSSDKDFENISDTVTLTPSFAKDKKDSFNFKPSVGIGNAWDANSFYKITFNVTYTSTSSNEGVNLTSIAFYRYSDYVAPEVINVPDVNLFPTKTADLSVTTSPNGSVLPDDATFVIDDEDVATYANGVITGVGLGTTTITVASASAGIQGTASITVSAFPCDLDIGSKYALYSTGTYKYEFNGVINNNVGSVVAYTEVPSCDYPIVVGAGLHDGTVTLKVSDKYLYYDETAGGNTLKLKDTLDDEACWVVTKNAEDDFKATTFNSYGGLSPRSIGFNYNSGNNPRFAAYTSTQNPIAFYKIVEKELVDFALLPEEEFVAGETRALKVTYDPADATDKALSWSSSNPAIATVDSDGKVTGVAVGKTTITASKTIGGDSVERACVVTVISSQAEHEGTAADPFPVKEAIKVAKGLLITTKSGQTINLDNTYSVRGQITAFASDKADEMSCWIGDNDTQVSAATGGFELYKVSKIYGTALADSYATLAARRMAFHVGAIVTATAKFTYFSQTTPETVSNTADIVFNNWKEAYDFCSGFNGAVGTICADDKRTAQSIKDVWDAQAVIYGPLDPTAKELCRARVAVENPEVNDSIAVFAAKYNYVCLKYELTDFANRLPTNSVSGASGRITVSTDSTLQILAVIAAGTIAMAGAILFIRKRKHND